MEYRKEILRYAFAKSLPVLFGYLFLGIAFGILFQQAGYDAVWACISSILCYGGSSQFALASLAGSGSPLYLVGLMTLFINARHIFYGISFVDDFKIMKQRPYMIFSLTDETYSVLNLCQKDEYLHMENNRAMFYIALFDHSYWIIGSVVGALAGQFIPFDFTGIDFSMTALFVVILVDRLSGGKEDKSGMLSAIAGLVIGAVCLFIFKPGGFILPAMVVTVIVLSIATGTKKEGADANE